MINTNDGGANVSVNGGESWTSQRFPTAQLYNVFTTAHVPYHVCGAQQDNTTVCVPSNGTGDDLYDVGGGESGYIAPDPLDVDVFYAGSYGGLLTRLNRRTGETRAINVWPDNPMGHNSGDMTERFQWTYPIVIAPTDPHTLYATSQHVWKSTNEGQSWQRISPDLTRHDPATMGDSGGPITLDQTGVETYATVFALAPSSVDGKVIWSGSDDGLVQVTRDGGQNVEQRDAAGSAGVRARQLHRRVAARFGDGLRGRQPVSAGRSRRRTCIERTTSGSRGRRSSTAFGQTISRARSRRIRRGKGCSGSAPKLGSMCRSTTAADWQPLQPRPAGHARAWHHRQERRSDHRHTRSWLLRPGQHQRAPAG